MNILVIEDEPKVALAIRQGLEAEGYQVTSTATGEEGYFLATTLAADRLAKTEDGHAYILKSGSVPEYGFEITSAHDATANLESVRNLAWILMAGPGTLRKEGGFGLGLAIARQAVELNGGTIGFHEKAGSGAWCRIVLPAKSSERQPPQDPNTGVITS